jgi:phosphatidylglycerol:prolipoprotein diacylglycerol transferase
VDAQAYYLHRISPFIVRFGENFGLRWYGVSYVAGFIVGLVLLRRLSRNGLLKLTYKEIDALLTYLIVGVIVGGRLGYVIFYEPKLLMEWESGFPFWGLLAINKGGMSSHGGFIAIICMVILFSRKYHYTLLHVGDAVVMVAPPGLFFGRVANFINGELFGRPAHVPWAVCFPTEIMNWSSEKVQNLFQSLREQGYAFSDIGELIDAVQRQDSVAKIIHPMLTPRHPSQIYEALLEGILLFVLLWFGRRKLKKDGMMVVLFLLGYGIVRIFAEQFREPDVGIGYQWLGLTRGQWLSFGMLAAAGIFFMLSMKQKPIPMKPGVKKRQSEEPRDKKKRKK